jgi:hypothetical protein
MYCTNNIITLGREEKWGYGTPDSPFIVSLCISVQPLSDYVNKPKILFTSQGYHISAYCEQNGYISGKEYKEAL